MFYHKLLQKLTGKPISAFEDQSAPPSYNEPCHAPCILPAQWSSPGTITIKPTDTPQWKWTAKQCKAWFFLVLTIFMDYDPATAEAIASTLDGYGPNIYRRNMDDWIKILGKENGGGVYMTLLTVRHKRGAIPRDINLHHGYEKKKTKA
jgi:hypothetical protein